MHLDQKNTHPTQHAHSVRQGGRQPMLWAALAFAAGLWADSYMWRPPLLWLVAGVVFTASAAYFLRRRVRFAIALGWFTLFVFGALSIQVRGPCNNFDPLPLSNDDVLVTAHVTREGELRLDGPSEVSQRIDVETEQIAAASGASNLRCGVRLSVYDKVAANGSQPSGTHLFLYGERLKFRAKLSPPRNYRNPGAFDYAGYLAQNGIQALASTKASEIGLLPGLTGTRVERWRTRLHRNVIERVHTLWPQPEAALMDAVVIGEEAFLARPSRVNFQRSGTYHVLVVSGMNVTILAFVTYWGLKRLRMGDIAASATTVALIVSYAVLTALGPPVWRATLMLTIYLGARLLYREKSMLNAIGAAALGVMIADPQALYGASFQLTFLCVWLVAAVGVPLLERTTQPYLGGIRAISSTSYDAFLPPKVAQFRLDLRMIAGRLARFAGTRLSLSALAMAFRALLGGCELIIISAVMQLGLALPMAYYFHRVTVVGLPANLFIIPLIELLMPSAISALVLSYVWRPLAKIPAIIARFALDGITGTVHYLGGLRIADARVAMPPLPVILLSCAAIALAMILARRSRYSAIAGLAAMTASALWIPIVAPRPLIRSGVLEVTAIDVGQGDSILVVSPQGRTLLIDAGGLPHWVHSELDIGEDVVSPYLWARDFSHLDVVALTHAHADHMGGMAAVLANFHPRELWLGVDAHTPELQTLLEEAKQLGIPTVFHTEGDQLEMGGASIRILAPPSGPQTLPSMKKESRRNDESLVMKISYQNTSALLEGDAERATEMEVTQEDPQADLLKVGHHGSNTSTMPELLAAVHPRFAVISVGVRNVYGHPRREVLQRLGNAKIATYRTDMDGASTFYLDGKQVTPKNY